MKVYLIISHTHWDREWYAPLEVFRLKLVDLIDHCLITLKKYPEYIFHLDAQTVVLDDYLAFRPSKEAELRQFITEGRLIVGPWYVQNDFYLTSGESTVRNLLEGVRTATRFGRCARIGYAPDQFGNVSQLPQILDGFRVDSFVFGRGYSKMVTDENGKRLRVNAPSEFLWKGPDGTEKLAVHMSFWYNNAQRFSEDIDRSMLHIDVADRCFDGRAATPYYLLMNGVDHLEAQDNLLPILEQMNRRLPADKRIVQVEMADYIDAVRDYIKENNIELETVEGELRMGGDMELLKGCLSSRSYLKRENVRAQNMLECRLEPLYAMLEMAGAKGAYSLDHFRYMWKELIKNHPHDSICGCSRDEVHHHMEDNFERLETTTGEILRRGQLLAAQHMGLREFGDNNYVLTVMNTTETARGGLVRVVMDFPVKENVIGFDIVDNDGKPADFDVLSHEKTMLDVFSPINLPGVMDVDRFVVLLSVPAVVALSIKGYIVKPRSAGAPLAVPAAMEKPSADKPVVMENECLKVTVTGGRVDIEDKKTGHVMENALRLEDTADKGDAYVYWPEENPQAIYSGADADVQIVEWTRFRQSVAIRHMLQLPVCYDFDAMKRAEERVDCPVILTLTLAKHEAALEVAYTVENRAKDHRIRLLVNTGLETRISVADTAFDVRHYDDLSHYPDTKSRVLPNTSFAAVEADGKGVAVFTEGEHEYEHLTDERSLAFTLVRSTGLITRNYSTFHSSSGEQWNCPDNQCLRTLSGRVGLAVFAGDAVRAGIPRQAKDFRNPLLGFFTSCDSRKFAGGRTAVQDTKLEEFFYLPDPYKAVTIPDGDSFVRATGDSLLLTAMKKAENGVGTILRYVNLSDQAVESTLTVKGFIYQTSMEEVGTEFLGQDEVTVTFGPKKILTFLVKTYPAFEQSMKG